ncbi:MAG: cyclic nucleotide-binding domain-containing protein, partial [Wenzhouxiangellaceae bacterium]|nr:cyclic nucleotide-binding domain-containing protein [Wenzhouxiangellaceae bacterium]
MSQHEILNAITASPVFGNMASGHAERLAAHASERRVEAGTCLFRAGEPAENFYLLTDGEVSVEIPAVAGPVLVVQHLLPVRVLGWSWLLP